MSSISDVTEKEAYRHSDPAVDQAMDWVVLLKTGGTPSLETKQAFQRWLDESADNSRAWEEVAELWARPEVMLASSALKAAPGKTNQQIRRRGRTISARAAWRIGTFSAFAAALLLFFGPSLYQSARIDWQADYRTEVGQLREVALPDGSKMVLNTQSAVAIDFASNNRNVRLLKGEAWFDVVHDPSRPFRVAARFSDVEVKGTAFAVDTSDVMDTVILQRGAVLSRHENPDIAPVDLKAGEMVHASASALSPITVFDPEAALGWTEGRIALSSTSLRSALNTIGKYYDGRVILMNSSLGDVAISGSYRTDNAEAAIDSVATAAGGQATHLPGGFIIIR